MRAKFIDLSDTPEEDVIFARALMAGWRDLNGAEKPALAAVFADLATAFDDELRSRRETLKQMDRSMPATAGVSSTPGIWGAVDPETATEPEEIDEGLVNAEPVGEFIAAADKCFMRVAAQVSGGRDQLLQWRQGALQYRAIVDETTGTVAYETVTEGGEIIGGFAAEFTRNQDGTAAAADGDSAAL